MNPEIFTFGELQGLIFDFEKLVKEKNAVLVEPGSKCEAAALAMMEMLATYKGEMPHNMKRDYREDWRRALSLGDILRKIMSLRNHPVFNTMWPHLMLLLGGGEIAQNLWSAKEDQNPNKVFELYVALLVLPVCTQMDLDDPNVSSGGKNPDIIAEINGESWAFACKAMHSPLAKSLLDRVRDGIEQIEATNAKKGIVVISLKNVLPHNQLWPAEREPDTHDYIYFSYPDSSLVQQRLQAECNRYQTELLELLGGPEGFLNVFKGSRAFPTVLVHLCTAISVLKDGRPTPHLMRMLGAINVKPLAEDVEVVFWLMNEMLHESYLDPAKLEERIAKL